MAPGWLWTGNQSSCLNLLWAWITSMCHPYPAYDSILMWAKDGAETFSFQCIRQASVGGRQGKVWYPEGLWLSIEHRYLWRDFWIVKGAAFSLWNKSSLRVGSFYNASEVPFSVAEVGSIHSSFLPHLPYPLLLKGLMDLLTQGQVIIKNSVSFSFWEPCWGYGRPQTREGPLLPSRMPASGKI